MSYPKHDLVTYKGKLYDSHLYQIFHDADWLPEEPTNEEGGTSSLFPHVMTSCWHGYIIVFNAVKGKNFQPTWLLAFTPVADAPVLRRQHRWNGLDMELHPEEVPTELNGVPLPQRHGYKSAYRLAPIDPVVLLYEMGVILKGDDQCTYMLELGVGKDNKVGTVIGFRKLHGPERDPMHPKQVKWLKEACAKADLSTPTGKEQAYAYLQKTWDSNNCLKRKYKRAGFVLPADQFWSVVEDHARKTGDLTTSLLYLWQVNKNTNPLLGKWIEP